MFSDTHHPSTARPASARRLVVDEIDSFVSDVLLSADRELPIVALTTWPDERGFPLPPDALAAALAGHADVVAVATGEDTWALSAALPTASRPPTSVPSIVKNRFA